MLPVITLSTPNCANKTTVAASFSPSPEKDIGISVMISPSALIIAFVIRGT